MQTLSRIPFILFLPLLLLLSCKKEEAAWQRCEPCSSELIVGEYSGRATHFRYSDSVNFVQTISHEVYLTVEEEGSALRLQTGVVNLFYASLSGLFSNTYYLSFAGANQQLNATIWLKDGQVRITGTVKKTAVVNDQPELRELFDFEVVKQ